MSYRAVISKLGCTKFVFPDVRDPLKEAVESGTTMFVVIQNANMGGEYWRYFWPEVPGTLIGSWCFEPDGSALCQLQNAKTGQEVTMHGATFKLEIIEDYVAKLIKMK